ncbi:Atp-dependent protease la, partial [Globisporangium splendens]
MEETTLQLPILPIDNKVLFPRTYMRLAITSTAALQLLKDLVWEVQSTKPRKATSLSLGIFTKRPVDGKGKQQASADDHQGLYTTGTLARVVQLTRIQDSNGLSVLVQGLHRIELTEFSQKAPYLVANVQKVFGELVQRPDASSYSGETIEQSVENLALKLKQLTQEYLEMSKSSLLLRKSNGLINAISNSSIGELADVVVSYLNADVAAKQRVLEAIDIKTRCELAIALLSQEIEKSKIQRKIQSDVQDKLEGTRKEFLLRQQLEAIKKELGETGDDAGEGGDLKLLEDKIKALTLNPKADKVVNRELRRLKTMNSSQPEYGIIHNYLEFFSELPWNNQTEDTLLVDQVRTQLDADHYGLEKVKKRITEYIAVRSLKNDMKGPILCLLGPPGVGKTSLGKSIATATGRKFERIALGGVHDESEIRGHRKTYIGAMPGCILNAVRHAESKNPVLLLDEVDKIGKDFRGDPSSALLEVLDPHQNHTFTDHYLNVPFDLSNVMFIATANSLDTIPAPLLDRMEIIEVSGYSVEQKIEIAKRYLLPRQVEENGLEKSLVMISDDTLRFLIMNYTREAGVRDLERQVGAICRYVAVNVVKEMDSHKKKNKQKKQANSSSSTDSPKPLSSFKPTRIDRAMIKRILGHELVFNEVALRSNVPGVATGMSWSTVGGSILFVEASCTRTPASQLTLRALTSSSSAALNAAPQLQLTGKLGDVMKESAHLALSWLRANARLIELPASAGKQDLPSPQPRTVSLEGISDVHIHFPEGAISKDGPSAGGAIVCALLSSISGIPVPIDIAMTGEITLRGVILPVGGIREKVLAAIRAGIKRIILPKGNKNEAEELKKEFANVAFDGKRASGSDVQVLFVSDLRELVELVFGMKVRDDSSLHEHQPPMHLSML